MARTIRVTLQANGAYWRAMWRQDGRQHARGLGPRATVTRREAEIACAELERRMGAGAEPDVPGLAEWIERYIRSRPDYAIATEALLRLTGASLAGFLGPGRSLDGVTANDAAEWRSALARGGLAESTVCRHVKEARTIFAEAVRRGLIPSNPFAQVRAAAPPAAKDWRYVPLDDYRALLAVAEGPWKPLLALCRLAGLRRGEATALTWEAVDLGRKRLTACKGMTSGTKHREREVPICPELHDALFSSFMGAEGEDLVCPVGSPSFHREMQAMFAAARLKPWPDPFHSLRKSRERDWIDEGFDPATVAAWQGHSVIVQAKHYLRAEEAAFKKASEREEAPEDSRTGDTSQQQHG